MLCIRIFSMKRTWRRMKRAAHMKRCFASWKMMPRSGALCFMLAQRALHDGVSHRFILRQQCFIFLRLPPWQIRNPCYNNQVFEIQSNTGEFPSGQRGQTVNLLRFASMVRIRPPPPAKDQMLCIWSFAVIFAFDEFYWLRQWYLLRKWYWLRQF